MSCAHQSPSSNRDNSSKKSVVSFESSGSLKDQATFQRSSSEAYISVLKAEMLMNHGPSPAAVQELKEALVHDTSSVYLKQRLAEALWAIGKDEEALKWNQRALDENPNPNYLCWRAWVSAQQGHAIKAKAIINQLQRETLFEETCLYRALEVMMTEPFSPKESELFLKQSLIPILGHSRAYFLMAESLLEAGHSESGERYLQNAYDIDPTNMLLLDLKWRYAFSSLNDADADLAARMLYTAEPSTLNAQRWVLTLLLNQDIKRAAQLSLWLFDQDRFAEDSSLWWPWMKAGYLNKAASLWSQNSVPPNIQLQMYEELVARGRLKIKTAKLCHKSDRSQWEKKCLHRLISEKKYILVHDRLLQHLKENTLEGWMIRLWVYMGKGPGSVITAREINRVFHLMSLDGIQDVDLFIAKLEAADIFQEKRVAYEILDEYLDHGDSQRVWAGIIWLLEQEQPRRALEVLESHLKLKQNPDVSTLNLMAFTMAEARVSLQEAIAAGKKAVLLEPMNPAIIDTLGWAYFQAGQLDKAKRYLKRAYALEPKEVEIAWHLASLYAEVGDFQKAQEILKDVDAVFTLSDRLRQHIKRLKESLKVKVGQGV